MNKVIKITTDLKGRVETGPIQFDDDWPGIFIRGDVAINNALIIESYLAGENIEPNEVFLKNLGRLLRSCTVRHDKNEDE